MKLENIKPRYSGVVLTKDSHDKLLAEFKYELGDWKQFAHHMTINPFGLVPDAVVGTLVKLTVTHFGRNEKAMAVKVTGYEGKTNNKFPHITLAVNVTDGGKPKDSNDITEWKEIDSFDVFGVIENI